MVPSLVSVIRDKPYKQGVAGRKKGRKRGRKRGRERKKKQAGFRK